MCWDLMHAANLGCHDGLNLTALPEFTSISLFWLLWSDSRKLQKKALYFWKTTLFTEGLWWFTFCCGTDHTVQSITQNSFLFARHELQQSASVFCKEQIYFQHINYWLQFNNPLKCIHDQNMLQLVSLLHKFFT